jgi:hypothetical protein
MHAVTMERPKTDQTDKRDTIPYVDDFIHLNSGAGALADQRVYDQSSRIWNSKRGAVTPKPA